LKTQFIGCVGGIADKCKFKVNCGKNAVFLDKFNYPIELNTSKEA